jgi:hypothetical protein
VLRPFQLAKSDSPSVADVTFAGAREGLEQLAIGRVAELPDEMTSPRALARKFTAAP